MAIRLSRLPCGRLPSKTIPEAFAFAERLFRGEFDMMVLLTGVGTRALDKALASRYPPQAFAEALRKIAVVARGSQATRCVCARCKFRPQ